MSYELAKQLKDAGFPQNGAGKRVAPPEAIVARRDDFAYVPTLEELIEACGAHISALKTGLGCWFAEGERQSELIETKGATPTEAVACLWLALHPSK